MVGDTDDNLYPKRRKVIKAANVKNVNGNSGLVTEMFVEGSEKSSTEPSSNMTPDQFQNSRHAQESEIRSQPMDSEMVERDGVVSAQVRKRRDRASKSDSSLPGIDVISLVKLDDRTKVSTGRKRGRPRKIDTTEQRTTSSPHATLGRRRSERGQPQVPAATEVLNPQIQARELEVVCKTRASLQSEVIDLRRRHANGKPMGRPRKSDSTRLSASIVKRENEDNDGDISEALNMSENATNKPSKRRVGRPRKGEELRNVHNFSVAEGIVNSRPVCDTETSRVKQHKPNSDIIEDRPHLPQRSRLGVRKIKLTFEHISAPPIVTHPAHLVAEPQFHTLDAYLDSFVSLDDDVSLSEARELRDAHQLLKTRVSVARESGMLNQALKVPLSVLKSSDPVVPLCHQDHLATHARFFSKLMQDERKRNYSNARKVASMVLNHFKRISGADEREHAELQRVRRQIAKKTANEIRRKWRLAEKELHRRSHIKLQAEQRAAGKLQLNQILEHSTNLLDARMNLRDDNASSDEMSSDSCEDHYLSVEELRRKYANVPDLVLDSGGSFDGYNSDTAHSCRDRELAHAGGDEDASEDASVMDSENDLPSTSASESGGDCNSPGLSCLYPELSANSELNSSAGQRHSNRTHLENIHQTLFESPPKSSDIDIAGRQSFVRRSSVELVGLESDDEAHDLDDDSPMDSEMDDISDGSQGSEESDNGPDLTWLYSTPLNIATHSAGTEQPKSADAPRDCSPHSDAIATSKSPTPDHSPVEEHLSIIKTPVPTLLRGNLREYQHTGLDWLAGLYLSETNGILADEMGLGKTIQTISLLTWLACEQHIWGTHLVVVPTSVMLNWEMEFKKFAPGLKVLTYYGNPKERKEKRRGWSKVDAFHVVITSYQLVITDASVFRRKKWEYMILDEAHNIKNFKSQRWQTMLNFNTKRRLLLTGTPLQNNLNELWSLLYFLMPKGLSMNPTFANLTDFQEWFSRPVDKLIEDGTNHMNDEARATVAKLHRILRPYILRRLKADVEKQMPGKYEHIITCRLSKRQRYLYDDFMSRSGTRSIMASGNFLSIINCFMQLRKVCNHPDLFESRPILTSFAMKKSAVAKFEINELCIRRRLLAEDDSRKVSLSFLNLKLVLGKPTSCGNAIKKLELHTDTGQTRTGPITSEAILTERSDYSISQKTFDLSRDVGMRRHGRHRHQSYINEFRCSSKPVYSHEILSRLQSIVRIPSTASDVLYTTNAITRLKPVLQLVCEYSREAVCKFACVTPKAVALDLPALAAPMKIELKQYLYSLEGDYTHFARTATSIAFPDRRLLQFDCGKLQRLDSLLRELIGGGHRVLIFTQMTRMLDILEQFLNIHGHRYFRLDGSTKIEVRQNLTETFNNDARIPIFILSTRSGGLGINLTGADTVIFYDSDWNPSMDRQCQDRAHRIGQTRDVHIYRFVSEYTIEQNILRKANQKRMLDNVVIGEGDFTTDFFDKVDWKDMLGNGVSGDIVRPHGVELETALATAEDEDDVYAAKVAQQEMDIEAVEFAEHGNPSDGHVHNLTTALIKDDALNEEVDDGAGIGSIDDYMLTFLERELVNSTE